MIDILMATYNGERFLQEQIDSILAQTEQDFRLLIQDDGSQDGTIKLLSDYEKAYPSKIQMITGLAHTKGPCGNFMSLLSQSKAEHIMFSDQDDRWHPDKIAIALRRMQEGEKQYGKQCPLLVHTDLQVVDQELQPMAASFFRYQKLDPQHASLERLLVQNCITGCTVMLNQHLAAIMRKAPADKMLMHDWWAALAAVAFGQILLVEQTTIDYRQHGKNQLGATGFDAIRDTKKAAAQQEDVRRRLWDTYRQAADFCDCYSDCLPEDAARCIKRYGELPGKSKTARAYTLLRYGYLKYGLVRRLGQMVYC